MIPRRSQAAGVGSRPNRLEHHRFVRASVTTLTVRRLAVVGAALQPAGDGPGCDIGTGSLDERRAAHLLMTLRCSCRTLDSAIATGLIVQAPPARDLCTREALRP